MSKHIVRYFGAFLIAVILPVTTVVPVLAMESRAAENVAVASGEVVNDDLYVMGRDVIIDGTVKGDVIAFAQRVTINGVVEGSLNVAAQMITVNGQVIRGARQMLPARLRWAKTFFSVCKRLKSMELLRAIS